MRSTRFRLHVGIESRQGKGMGGGKGGGGKESGCMRPGWVGSDAFLLMPFLPIPSARGQLDPGARHANTPTTLNLSSNSQLSYIASARLQAEKAVRSSSRVQY